MVEAIPPWCSQLSQRASWQYPLRTPVRVKTMPGGHTHVHAGHLQKRSHLVANVQTLRACTPARPVMHGVLRTPNGVHVVNVRPKAMLAVRPRKATGRLAKVTCTLTGFSRKARRG